MEMFLIIFLSILLFSFNEEIRLEDISERSLDFYIENRTCIILYYQLELSPESYFAAFELRSTKKALGNKSDIFFGQINFQEIKKTRKIYPEIPFILMYHNHQVYYYQEKIRNDLLYKFIKRVIDKPNQLIRDIENISSIFSPQMNDTVIFVGNVSSKRNELYTKFARKTSKFQFYRASFIDSLSFFGYKTDAVVIQKNNSGVCPINLNNPKINFSLSIEMCYYPNYLRLNETTYHFLFNTNMVSIIFFLPINFIDVNFNSFKIINEISKKYRGIYNSFTIFGNNSMEEKLIKFLAISEFPRIEIIYYENDYIRFFISNKINKEEIIHKIDLWEEQKIPQIIKSEEFIAGTNKNKNIKRITGNTFFNSTFNNSKNIIVLFHTKNCIRSKFFFTAFNEISEILSECNFLDFGEIDGELNDSPGIVVKEFPFLIGFKSSKKYYINSLKKEEILDFIMKNEFCNYTNLITNSDINTKTNEFNDSTTTREKNNNL